MHYAEISRETGASTATITRIASWLNHGEGGYRLAAGATGAAQGRQRPPTPSGPNDEGAPPPRRSQQGPARRADAELLHDAGLIFEEHDRSLVARVQNFELDILFVRTNDIIEFVGDGVADLGITGIDLLSESGAELPRIRELGYGGCRLAAAVPNDAPQQAVEDLAGLRVATAHPNTARRFFEERGIPVDVIPISGAVEVAPRLGLAEAHRRPRVDRLDPGHERPAPDRRRPRVGGGPRRQPDRRSRARVRARRHRHHALGGHRRPRPQVPDDERARRQAPRARAPAAGARIARRSSRSPTTG